MPEIDTVWFSKEDGTPVLVLFVAGYRLTYQKGSGVHAALVPVSLGEFLEDYQQEVLCTT